MNDHMRIYEAARAVPQEAQKPIKGGRLNGMTDINPMWRIAKLTELFGAAGIGWYIDDVRHWLEPAANGEVLAFCSLNLYILDGEEWSKPIFGIGGSKLTAKESNGLFNSDEGYKMAYTDAISVACKALGFGADIYWANGRSKYTEAKPQKQQTEAVNMEAWWNSVTALGYAPADITQDYAADFHDGQLSRADALRIYKELKDGIKIGGTEND